MWKTVHSNVLVLFLWTIYGPLLIFENVRTSAGVRGQRMPAQNTFRHTDYISQMQQQQQQQPCDRTRRVFTDTYGEISDGPAGSNYTQDSHCEWLIKAKNESQFITLTFHSMGTECSYDYVFVYDGDSFKDPLLGSFSGKTEPQKVVATSGSMLILLYSDTNYVLEGFKAEFRVSNCPNNCSDQGKCVGHQCVCHGDWIGTDCSLHACPDSCGVSEGRGVCLKEHCRCNEGYSGKSCSLHNIDPPGNEWHWMSTFQGGLSPRAAHTAIYVPETDALYVFGGYDLNKVLGSLQIYRFNKSTWEDEWGISLRSRHFPNEIDNALIKAVLHQNDDDEARRWGLKNDASFFRNILLTISDQKFVPRIQRSTPVAGSNDTLPEPVHDLTDFLEEFTDKPRPANRYGHAVAAVGGGFVIFGGKLGDVDDGGGGLSDELWFFNVTQNEGSGQWEKRAVNSTLRPPALTRHSMTNADGELYVFGGSLRTGEFSSRIYKIRLSSAMDEQWHEVAPRGGKALDVRVVAHTTVFHRPSNSLIVYGGVVAGVARFSKLSDRMFAFQLNNRHWTEIQYPRAPIRDAYIPRERAFHSATVIGNYMLIFGGYSHRHNKEEICYDNQMYLYHLGCHTWINQDVLGTADKSAYPKRQGVFAHAATVRNGNTLLIVGGYHGNVNADLLAYTLPEMLVVRNQSTFDPEAVCPKHAGVSECLSDPECGWCSADNVCYGRTIGANCTTNLQTTRCPGICPALGDCHACLIHGMTSLRSMSAHSVANKFGLNQCTWCVQNARCHHRDDNYGVCGEDTPSSEPGWWGTKGTEVLDAMQCTRLDHRPGLTFLKYLAPVNWTQPDDVSVVNATMVDFVSAASTTHTEQHVNASIVARLLGFIRPPKTWRIPDHLELMHACASYSRATLTLGQEPTINLTAEQSRCVRVEFPQTSPDRFSVDFQARRVWESGIGHYQHSKMGLQHNGTHEIAKAFTFEYLEPYANGTCEQYVNCAYCLSDSMCGWCDLTNKCAPREDDERVSCSTDTDWQYLVIQPSKCANCSNYISCGSCLDSGLCEWWAEDARCARLGRSSNAVRVESMCPAPCPERPNCSACLEERGRCVWCAATSQCFSFSVYTSEFQFGLCREWLDQAVPFTGAPDLIATPVAGESAKQQQCKSCAAHANCSVCLQSLSCGWCFDRDNPIEGLCMEGDFNRSRSDCAAALNATAPDEAEWAYAQCPDVDECGLGLHDCHKEAKCTNTHGSYNCHCRRGFVGDGRTACVRTCYDQCVNGWCSGGPDFVCRCDLGWTGSDCSSNCGCNNHSKCDREIGTCDKCENWTEGDHCERCKPGSFGNATSSKGCKPCECNGHGNKDLGICDVQTGECYCQDNTEGLKCEMCNRNFYGDPFDGGQCYFQCEARGMLKEGGRQGIGSHQSHKHHWGPEASECLWIVSPHTANGSILTESLIQLEISSMDLNVTCGENAVYVYDGLPDLIGNTQQSQLLAVFCSADTNPMSVEARSGHLTVHYKQGPAGQGFNATYFVLSCLDSTCLPPHVCNEHKQCVCPTGYAGPVCENEVCMTDCSASNGQGHCDTGYGRCVCSAGFGGEDCSQSTEGGDRLIVSDLFNAHRLSDSFEHLRKTLPRFGHSLVTDKRGSLWMFGGYSLSHGPLNDIRQFDTKNNTWTQVTVDSTPDAKMPEGRYFHAADIMSSRQVIYVFGGLSELGKVLGDFWQFTLSNQRWEEVSLDDEDADTATNPPPLAGTTMTLIRDADQQERLLLIGGFAPKLGLHGQIYEFDFGLRRWSVIPTTGSGPVGIFGHSTVFHHQSLYVFGGCEYSYGYETRISNRLFSFDYFKKSWSILPPFSGMEVPRARFLHSAVATDRYMLVLGGRTDPINTTDVLAAYAFDCNQWTGLTSDMRVIGKLPRAAYAQAMTLEPETNSMYVVGGWDGSSSQSRVTRLRIPVDLCHLYSGDKYMCRHMMGCSYCSMPGVNGTHCVSYDRAQEVCFDRRGNTDSTATVVNNGAQCDAAWFRARNCSAFDTCGGCLAAWPSHPESEPACKWCEKCSIGRCIRASDECVVVTKGCDFFADVSVVNSSEQCLEANSADCLSSDCEACTMRSGCAWTQYQNKEMCVSRSIVDAHSLNVTMCKDRCETQTGCHECLETSSMEGGYDSCRWSTQLNQCMSPSYQPMYCTGGVCGLVLSPDQEDRCPEPCNAYSQCATCLRHAHCGWCSRNDANSTVGGDGVCTEGSLESPAEHPAASTCDIIYASRNNLITMSPTDEFVWNYVKCPPENECENSHHNCNAKSQRCVDLEAGYACECGTGYRLDGKEKCVPVCSQGCVRGQCVDPNQCHCDFGYVGANCSIQCQCNGHSNCRGPDLLDECIECGNNTMGAQCDKCKPLFVGDPKDNGECVPCLDYCNGHSDICVARDTDAAITAMTRSELERVLDEGPTSDAVCLRCSNQTADDRCEGCLTGHFRGLEDLRATCRPCQCHGHGDSCDPVTGEKCNCGNNTESDATCSASSSRNSAQQCWMVQCSKCRDSYAGNPTEGHQCYKQITVESKMCFDAKTIDECKKPAPLRPGQTVFFVVQPRFMNVDIRIIVDVTQGELDLYMSPQDDSFVVHTNQSTGQHQIYLDNRYSWFPAPDADEELLEKIEVNPVRISATQAMDNITMFGGSGTDDRFTHPSNNDCHPVAPNGFTVYDRRASALSTYVTLRHCNTLLRVYGLKNRMVLTLPQSAHNLSATRFFIALKAANGPASYGLVFFRQDQLHIDLFVFFSVFFSCFFLFLAVCVVAWKAKQAADVRRARRRHVVEMLHMAKRPFSTVTLLIGAGGDVTPVQVRKRGRSHHGSASSSKHVPISALATPLVVASVRPVAVEPTADGLAAVGTVFISLPGKSRGPVSLALGSTLTIMSRHTSIHSRTFIRCLGSHAQALQHHQQQHHQQQHQQQQHHQQQHQPHAHQHAVQVAQAPAGGAAGPVPAAVAQPLPF